MTEEQIKEKALEYRMRTDDKDDTIGQCQRRQEDFIAGAHSRDDEVYCLLEQLEWKDGYIGKLKAENKKLKEINPLLNKAVLVIKQLCGDNCYVCDKLSHKRKEYKYCEEKCNGYVHEGCILRLLNVIKKSDI